jgi:carboxymethylenebutenolidase
MSETPTNLNISTVKVPRAGAPGLFIEAYLVLPDGPGPFPGVVVIHEIFGLNDNIRDISRRFAQQGYAALAVDLFSAANRVTCMMQIFYGILIRPLSNSTLADLKSALGFLRAQPGVNSGRVGSVGFCMGGSYALQLAIVDDQLRAASVFYGQNPRPMQAVAQACPIVGSYPEKDFTAKAAGELEAALERYNVPHDIKIYPDARHSFFNDQGHSFAPDAATDAWQRMLAFFDTHLKYKEL